MAIKSVTPDQPRWQSRYDALIESGIATNTRRAYRNDVIRFCK